MSSLECQNLSDRLDRLTKLVHTLNLFHDAQNAGHDARAVEYLDDAREQAKFYNPETDNPS